MKFGALLSAKPVKVSGKVGSGPNVSATWAILKKNWVPYCSWSLRVISAIVASIKTCKGMMSILRSIPSMTPYSLGVA